MRRWLSNVLWKLGVFCLRRSSALTGTPWLKRTPQDLQLGTYTYTITYKKD